MMNRRHTPDKKIGSDGLPLTILPDGHILKNTYKVSYLSAGGMGIIYLAEGHRKRYVLKEVDGKDSKSVIALNQEKATLERLEHPGIVKVLELFEESGYFYLVLEYIEGDNLLKKTPKSNTIFLSEKVVLDWAEQLLDIFAYLHSQNPPIIYRDLKPHNIILDLSGRIRLIDFGIARVFKKEKHEDTQLMGSAITASPEHYGEGQTDVRSDIYTIGATLYFLLTNNMGKREELFKYSSVRSINSKISERTERVIAKALQIKPEDRYQTIEEMREALFGASKSEARGALPYLLHTRKAEDIPAKTSELKTSGASLKESTPEPDVKEKEEKRIVCPRCSGKNQEDSSFCEFCGASLKEDTARKKDIPRKIDIPQKKDMPQKIDIPQKKDMPQKPEAPGDTGPAVRKPAAKEEHLTSEPTTPLPFSKTGEKSRAVSDRNGAPAKKNLLPFIIAAGVLLVFFMGLLLVFLVVKTAARHFAPHQSPSTTVALASPSSTPLVSLSPINASPVPSTPATSPSPAESSPAVIPSPTQSSPALSPSPGKTSPAILPTPTGSVATRKGQQEEMLLKEAITSMEEDNYNVAEEKLNDLVAHNPRYFDAYWYLGQCREKNGRKNDALKAYKKYAKAPPRQYEKLRYLARFFEESGDFKTAIPMRTAALKQKQTAEDYYILGNSYYQIKDYDNAGKYLSLATKLDKNNYFYHVLLAQARAKSGQKADAIKAYKRAYEINTDKTALLYQIALLANETGDYRTAREYLNLYIYQEYDAEKSQKAKQLLNKVKISIMKQLPPGIEKRTDFLPGVSVIGIMKYGESKKAYLRIQGYQEEVTEGQTIMDKYYVISIRESMVVLGDPETETYMVLKPL